MKNLKIISFSLLIIGLASCKKEPFWGINGKGSNTTETINYQSFSKIDLGFDADIFYTQDSIYKIEISAQSNIQRVIETEVNKSVLIFRASKRLWHHNPIKITIHSPVINGFYMSGSGNVYAENTLNTTSMDLNVSGSGGISIPILNADNIYGDISGSGKIKIEGGTSKNMYLNISGSGNIDALAMESQKGNIDVSGSGNVKVWITEQLDVHISGSGKVSYKGSPTIDTKISGSGNVIHLN
ncbi:MAG TPA: head GIN domain-containing protein [Bacteroidia bacterium]|nr:head GIN domain-containing protein [Bacteroidia bacterium]